MPEALIAPLDELEQHWREAMADEAFTAEFDRLLREYAGLPSLLYDAERFSELVGARVLLKREDLNHTGAHKIRNVLGQALLTQRMGKKRVIAETGAGQHGVATATACAYFGLDCVVYMGEVDTERQALNVARMQMLGAEVVPVTTGSRTLKDAINEALRDWVANVDSTHYMLGTAAGPHPFPAMVRDFTRGIGDEARAQCLELTGRLPDAVLACVGGGSNAIGMFTAFVDDDGGRALRLRGRRRRLRDRSARRDDHRRRRRRAARHPLVPAAGRGRPDHRVALDLGRPRLPGVGPEHAWLAETGRATYRPITDAQAMDAMAAARPHRGHHPGDRERPRARRRVRRRPRARPRRHARRVPVRPRRQGHGHRRRVVRLCVDVREARRRSTVTHATERPVRRSRPPAPKAARPWSATCRPASPTSRRSIALIQAMVDGGCDVIEVGLPYSDPVMDGPTIQAAAERALCRRHAHPRRLPGRRGERRRRVPTLVMTYWNPVERYGVERFAADLAAAAAPG